MSTSTIAENIIGASKMQNKFSAIKFFLFL